MQKKRRMPKTLCTKLANAGNDSTYYLVTTKIVLNLNKVAWRWNLHYNIHLLSGISKVTDKIFSLRTSKEAIKFTRQKKFCTKIHKNQSIQHEFILFYRVHLQKR